MVGEMVVLVNRTSQILEVCQNGREIALKPGENVVTADWIRFAKMQHPRMGTFDPSGMHGDYLIGVKGYDDCSPIPPGEEHKSVERFDRSQMADEGREAVAVATGIRAPIRRTPQEMGSGLPDGAQFSNRDR